MQYQSEKNKCRPKKILMVISTMRCGGAETQCRLLIENLDREKYEIALLCVSNLSDWTPPFGVKLYLTGSRQDESLFTRIGKIKKAINDFNPDLIHTWIHDTITIPSAFFARLKGIPCITSRRSAYFSLVRGGTLRDYLVIIADLFGNQVISNSNVLKTNSLLYYVTFRMRKGMVIPNGTLQYIPSDQSGEIMGKIISDRNFKIIYTGRFVKVKRLDLLIRAFLKLKSFGYKVSLYLCGGTEKDLYFNLNDILGVNGNKDTGIIFCGYQLNWRELGAHCDLYVSASNREGMSNSVVEAMSVGLPVVVTDIPANTDICENGKDSIIVKSNDLQSLYDGIKKVIDDRILREHLKSNVKNTAYCYSLPVMVVRYESVYDALLGH